MKKLVAALVLGSLVLFGCLNFGSGSPATPTPAGSAAATSQPSASPSPTATPQPVVVNMTAQSNPWKYTPSVITVPEGAEVRLYISAGANDQPQSFLLPDFGVSKVIAPGTTELVEFVANKPPGTYQFTCSLYCGSGSARASGQLIIQ